MKLAYVMPRMARHFLPDPFVRSLLRKNLIIQPGIETRDAVAAVARYREVLTQRDLSFQDKRVLVFGYGGRFDFATALLRAGASHVVLCDRYASPDTHHHRQERADQASYFLVEGGTVRPRPEFITLLHGDIREESVRRRIHGPVDFVISNSVFEHLEDVEGTTLALAEVTQPHGHHIHFIDLRDHFFKYPFEMLRFSEYTWRHWLNPSSHHNRYRSWNFRGLFARHFNEVAITVVSRNELEFNKAKHYIRPEFVSGDTQEDSIEVILVVARKSARGEIVIAAPTRDADSAARSSGLCA